MSRIAVRGAETGSGVFTIQSPTTNTDRTLTLPDEAGTVLVNGTTSNVGIGTSSPNKPLTVATPQTANTVMEVLRLTGSGTYNSGGSNEAGAGVSFGQYSGSYPNWNLGQISGVRSGASWDGALTFSTNSGSTETSITERMRIDSAGRVTMPYQPMATFYIPSQVTATEGSVISWDNSTHEQGGLTANTSTNRMTVPVAGKYLVSVGLNVSSTASNNIGDGIFLNIVKNGTIYLASSAHVMHNFGAVTGVEIPFYNTMIVSCAANDYITFSFTNLSSSAIIQYGSANIYLIG
jgi:hypothetical protein